LGCGGREIRDARENLDREKYKEGGREGERKGGREGEREEGRKRGRDGGTEGRRDGGRESMLKWSPTGARVPVE
jgi:hypothetical protein